MTEYAPAAIERLFQEIKAVIPGALMGGILGDAAHDGGYHRGRDYCAPGDYSTQLPEDQQGDGQAASALDLSWTTAADHYEVSQRLMDASDDSRMVAARSFFGSVDGRTVCGWDFYGGYPVTSDDSHLWHIHLSILRKYANDWDALAPIADVITGGGAPISGGGGGDSGTGDWLDMASMEDVKSAVRSVLNEGTAQGQQNWAGTSKATLSGVQGLINSVNGLEAQNHEEFMTIVYGDGRDVDPGADTHPCNLKVIRQLCLDVLAALPPGD
jgi:hypothetical protein